MKSNRLLRVGEEIKKELATLLNFKIEEYRGKFLTITEARISRDLHYADVWVMVMADMPTQIANISQLNADAWRFRKEIAGKLYMRHIPELRFHLDSTLDNAHKIDGLLRSSGLTLDGKQEIE
jgi:ribosome-binding factor A